MNKMTNGTTKRAKLARSTVRRRMLSVSVAVAAGMGLVQHRMAAAAQTLTWDPSQTPATPSGGTGIWITGNSTALWSNGGNVSWTDTTGNDTAVFAGTAGNVTLSSTETANALIFSTAGYLLTGGTLNLAGTTPTITVNGNTTITSTITDSVGLTVAGNSTLTFSGTGSMYTGNTTINSGSTLELQSTGGESGGFVSSTTVNGTLQLDNANTPVDNMIIGVNNSTGTITGNGTINKTGVGWTEFDYNYIKSFSGTVNVLAGTLGNANGRSTWGNSTTGMTVNVSSGAFLDLRGNGIAIGALTGNGTVENTVGDFSTIGNGTLTVGVNGASGNFSGAIQSGAGVTSLMKVGSGTQALSGASINYTGATTVTAGTLQLQNATGFASATTIAGNGTLELYSTNGTVDTWTSGSMTIAGNGTLNKTGSGWVDLTNANALTGFNGTLNIQAGTFGPGFGTGGIGGNSSTMAVNVSSGALFDIRATGPGSGFTASVQIDRLSGSGTVGTTYSTATRLTIGTGNGSSTFAGSIAGNGSSAINLSSNPNASALSLIKVGTGSFTLLNANSYTGSTTISAGTLVVASTGTLGSNSATTVASGGTLVITAGSASGTTLANTLTLSGGTVQSVLDNAGSGGTISFANGNVTHTFTGNGTLTLPTAVSATVLEVGGGGGAGGGWTSHHFGAGGGGGEVVNLSSQSLSGTVTVTVGTGGAGGAGGVDTVAGTGGTTQIGSLTSAPGGFGGGDTSTNGPPGGNSPGNNQSGTQSATFTGGSGLASSFVGGGGAGSSNNGGNATNPNGGSGGNGTIGNITGVAYGGGGGAGGPNGSNGGTGGGAAGVNSGTSNNGTPNTGGGGGGSGSNNAGGSGGSGIAAIQYAYNPIVGAGAITLGGNISVTATSTLDAYGSGGSLTASGIISGVGGINIASSNNAGGVVTFNGSTSNTYSGATTINAGGTLRANNTGGTSTGSGNITVNTGSGNYTGGMLGGSGNVSGTVTLASSTTAKWGGIIAAGANSTTIGTLTTGNQAWNGGAAYEWKITNSGNVAVGSALSVNATNDLLNIGTTSSNTLTVTGNSTDPFTIAPLGNLSSSITLGAGNKYNWELAQIGTGNATQISVTNAGVLTTYSANSTIVGSGNWSTAAFALDTSNLNVGNSNPQFLSASNFSLSFETISGNNDLVLSYNAAPEPGTTLLVLAGAVPMLMGRRRRSKK